MSLGVDLAILGGIYLAQRLYSWADQHGYFGPRPRTYQHHDFALPIVTEGAPIPMAWGRVRIKQPILIDYFTPENRVGPAFTVSHDPPIDVYFVHGMLFALCIAPDQCELSVLSRWWIGDREMGPQYADLAPIWGFSPMAAQTTKYVTMERALGGDREGGGVSGYIDFMDGEQSINAPGVGGWIPHFVEWWLDNYGSSADLPGYRGVLKVAFSGNKDAVSTPGPGSIAENTIGNNTTCHPSAGWHLGESPALAPYSFEVIMQPYADEASAPAYYKTAGLFGGWNPIGVIHDILTGSWAKVGLPESVLDLASFEAAAETLAAEGHGYSRVCYEQVDAVALIEDILDEVDGQWYQHPETGLITIKLIRDDYDVEDLPTFDESNIVGIPEVQFQTWHETFNKLQLTYEDVETAEQAVIEAHDPANVAAQGKQRILEYRALGINRAELAARVAARKLKFVSTPLKRLKFVADRDAMDLLPGDVFIFSWGDYPFTPAVFRVTRTERGELEDNRVVIEAVEDTFGLGDASTVIDPNPPNDVPEETPINPPPIMEAYIEETPRWMLYRAQATGIYYVTDPELSRFYYLGVPLTNEDASYRGEIKDAVAPDFGVDTAFQSFPVHAETQVTYSRTAEPYDTSTGLRIIDLSDTVVLTGATSSGISNQGRNVIFVVTPDGDCEIMAYESYTDLGSSVYRLNNVWRGLMDTPAIQIPAGSRVYFPMVVTDLGEQQPFRWLGAFHALPTVGDVVNGRIVPRSTSQVGVAAASEPTPRTVRGRPALPLPAADFKLGQSTLGAGATLKDMTSPTLAEEGLVASWRRRKKITTKIEKGTNASQTPETLTEYRFFAQKRLFSEDLGAEVNVTQTSDILITVRDAIDGASCDWVPLAKPGHGRFQVQLRTIQWNDVTATDDDQESWRDPTIDVVASTWRNLLLNPNFNSTRSAFTDYWTATVGAITTGNTAGESLAQDGVERYLQGSGIGDWTARQTIDCRGYVNHPSQTDALTVVLYFYLHNLGTGADDVTVTLETLNSSDSVINTTNFSGTPSNSQWTKHTLTLTTSGAFAKVRVTIAANALVELDPCTIAFAKPCLRIGQVTGQLISNTGFNGGLSSWSTASGTPTIVSTNPPPYESSNYAGSTTSEVGFEIYQDISLTSGYVYGAGVLEAAVCNRNGDVNDTAEVILEARLTSGGTVLGTATSGASAVGTDTWQRRRVVLDPLPEGTTSLRVRLVAARVGDVGLCDVGFDDIDLRVHKHLDPDFLMEVEFDEPVTQPMPATVDEWHREYTYGLKLPETMAPFSIWDGTGSQDVEGRAGFTFDNGVDYITRFVGPWNGETCVYNAMRFTQAGTADLVNTTIGGYSSFDSFWWLAWVKCEEAGSPGLVGILGRVNSIDRGWTLEMDADGKIVATLYGDGATIQKVSTASIDDLKPHLVGIAYRASTDTLCVIVDGVVETTSTATVGEFASPGGALRIGRAIEDGDAWPGQIARVYRGRASTEPTNTNFTNMFTHGLLYGEVDTVNPSTSDDEVVVIVPGKDGISGEDIAVLRMPRASQAMCWDHAAASRRWAWPVSKEATGIFQAWRGTLTSFGSPTVATGQEDVEGIRQGRAVTGSDANGVYALLVSLATGSHVTASFFARTPDAAGSHVMKVELTDTSDVIKQAWTFTVDETWRRFDLRTTLTTTWDGSTANARLKFYPLNSGAGPETIIISDPILIHRGSHHPLVLPLQMGQISTWAVPSTWIELDASLAQQHNVEGEIEINGRCAENPGTGRTGDFFYYKTAANNDDSRHIKLDATDVLFDHYGGSVLTTNNITPGADVLKSPFVVRGRWARAFLLENGAGYKSLWLNSTVDYETGSFTPGTSAVPSPIVALGATTAANTANVFVYSCKIRTRESTL